MAGALWLVKDFFFPRPLGCALCRAPGDVLCPACHSALKKRLAPNRCPKCGRGVYRAGFCLRCAQGHFSCDAAQSAYAYSAAQDAILAFKYHGYGELARPFARDLLLAAHSLPLKEIGMVIPVPSHPLRVLARGYNQAGLLAGAVAEGLGLPLCPQALKRVVHKPSMSATAMEYTGRRAWVQGCYALGRGACGGSAALLVDDVLTSGATLSCCAELLKSAGTERVYALTAAAVDDLP